MQWLRLLLSSKGKFKTGDERQTYAIEHPEPLLHFALSSGNHSDPAVMAILFSSLFSPWACHCHKARNMRQVALAMQIHKAFIKEDKLVVMWRPISWTWWLINKVACLTGVRMFLSGSSVYTEKSTRGAGSRKRRLYQSYLWCEEGSENSVTKSCGVLC